MQFANCLTRHLYHQQPAALAFLQEDLCAFNEFNLAAGRNGSFADDVIHFRQVFVYQPPVAVVQDEVADALGRYRP